MLLNIYTKLKKPLYFIVILGILLQVSQVANIFTPHTAKAASNIVINEFVSNPSSGNEWVELYNSTASAIDVTGWRIKDALENNFDSALSGNINAGSFMVVESGSSILDNPGDTVKLYNNSSTLIDSKIYGDSSLAAPAQDKSAGRTPDGNSTWITDLTPTKGTANLVPDITNPITASVTAPVNGNYYNSSTIPSLFSGKAADNIGGDGLLANSTKFYLKNSTGQFWDGFVWQNTETWLATTHSSTTGKIEIPWNSNVTLPVWTNGPFMVKAKATDISGNFYQGTEISFMYSNPTGSVKINDGKGVTNSKDVILTLSVNDQYQMAIDNEDFVSTTTEIWIPFTSSYSHELDPGNGTKTVYVKFKDQAGNVSNTYTASIYYNSLSQNITQNNIVSGINNISYENIMIENLSATGSTTLTLAAYTQNPESSGSFSAFGDYFDISVENASVVTFPVSIKIYYTQTDLDSAGITNESQIKGLYYWDSASSTWKLYSDDGQSTTGVVITSEKAGYIGYVWANVYHFTPMSLGADTTNPNKPANFKAESGDAQIKLSWDKISDASGYYVRYREGTNSDANKVYTEVFLSGNDKTTTTISGLTNNKMYEFGVQAKDDAGNISDWAVVEATPKTTVAAVTAAETTKLAKSLFGISSVYAAGEAGKEEIKADTDKEITTEEGEVKAEEEEEASQTESTRAAVTIGIIIIAIGAALGGYYGYQWWLSREEKPDTPKPPKKDFTDKPKSKDKSRRW